MTSQQSRLHSDLRDGLGQRMMPVSTLRALLAAHSFNRDEFVYAWSWRHGPKGKLTIYDLNLPRRQPPDEDEVHGHHEDDWWIHSTAMNCSDVAMGPYTGTFWESRCEPCQWFIVDTQPHRNCLKRSHGACTGVVTDTTKSPGYKNVLTALLNIGSLVPSAALSAWVEDDSRKWAKNYARLFYKDN